MESTTEMDCSTLMNYDNVTILSIANRKLNQELSYYFPNVTSMSSYRIDCNASRLLEMQIMEIFEKDDINFYKLTDLNILTDFDVIIRSHSIIMII
ncbi:hypothetical protein I4U23_012162 [Adineta vaga]|nr:hypothetical protein I4U23_012162 [Adineta vaga]